MDFKKLIYGVYDAICWTECDKFFAALQEILETKNGCYVAQNEVELRSLALSETDLIEPEE